MNYIKNIVIALFAVTTSFAGEALDWNKLASKVTGSWHSTKVTPRAELPAGFPIPKLSIKIDMRADGTARMKTDIEGEGPSDTEFHYCLGKEVITFYDPKA